MCARLAQSVEHETLNLRVVGSSPTLGGSFFFFVNFKGRKSTFLLSPFCSDGKFLERFFLNICVHFWGLKLRKVTHIYDLWAVHDQNMTSFTL